MSALRNFKRQMGAGIDLRLTKRRMNREIREEQGLNAMQEATAIRNKQIFNKQEAKSRVKAIVSRFLPQKH